MNVATKADEIIRRLEKIERQNSSIEKQTRFLSVGLTILGGLFVGIGAYTLLSQTNLPEIIRAEIERRNEEE